jgi:hypothetical protein
MVVIFYAFLGVHSSVKLRITSSTKKKEKGKTDDSLGRAALATQHGATGQKDPTEQLADWPLIAVRAEHACGPAGHHVRMTFAAMRKHIFLHTCAPPACV